MKSSYRIHGTQITPDCRHFETDPAEECPKCDHAPGWKKTKTEEAILGQFRSHKDNNAYLLTDQFTLQIGWYCNKINI